LQHDTFGDFGVRYGLVFVRIHPCSGYVPIPRETS
jgi:hypothetical protein